MDVAHAAAAVEQHTHDIGHDVGVSNTTASLAGVLSFRRRKMHIGMVPLYGRLSISANPAAAQGVLPTKRQHQPRLWWLIPCVSGLAVRYGLNAPTKQGRPLGWPVDHPRGVDGQQRSTSCLRVPRGARMHLPESNGRLVSLSSLYALYPICGGHQVTCSAVS